MGPLILLSLLGIGAATAFVDILPSSESSDSDTPDEDPNEDTAPNGQTAPGPAAALPASTTISGTEGDDTLTARGTEDIDAGAGDDHLSSWGSGVLQGDQGNDAFDVGGTATAYGGAGEDYMHISEAGTGYGGDGDDTFRLSNDLIGGGGPATADGGDGDDTFLMHPLSGLPDDAVAHVLTGGAGADTFALDIDSAISIRAGDEADDVVVATITDFNPAEDMLLVDLGVASNHQDVDDLATPTITTSEDPDGGFTDVHFSWTNPLNEDNVETRSIRLEGITNFSAGEVQLTSVFDPDAAHHDEDTTGAAANRLFALTPTDGTSGDDALTLSENSATTLGDGDDSAQLEAGAHLVYGGDGNDTIEATSSDVDEAQLFGGDGDDVLTTDLIRDTDTSLFGGEGDDAMTFGLGHYVDGNAGNDALTLNVHANALNQGPAVVQELTGNHITINIPAEVTGEVNIVNHLRGNGFEVAYSEIFVGDVAVLKVLEEDYENGIGIAEIDARVTIVRNAVL